MLVISTEEMEKFKRIGIDVHDVAGLIKLPPLSVLHYGETIDHLNHYAEPFLEEGTLVFRNALDNSIIMICSERMRMSGQREDTFYIHKDKISSHWLEKFSEIYSAHKKVA